MNLLDLVAGPSGAGKCTFVELILGPLLSGSVFVNADEIARALADEPCDARVRRCADSRADGREADRAGTATHRSGGLRGPPTSSATGSVDD
jgi:predicted ABC-type ATPase